MTELYLEHQINKFHNRNNFKEFVKKVIEKYNSDKYRDRWFKRNIEPPEDLYHFLFDYVAKYGRKCDHNEWQKYGNEFTVEMLYHEGYYFSLLYGQGSPVIIIDIDEKV